LVTSDLIFAPPRCDLYEPPTSWSYCVSMTSMHLSQQNLRGPNLSEFKFTLLKDEGKQLI